MWEQITLLKFIFSEQRNKEDFYVFRFSQKESLFWRKLVRGWLFKCGFIPRFSGGTNEESKHSEQTKLRCKNERIWTIQKYFESIHVLRLKKVCQKVLYYLKKKKLKKMSFFKKKNKSWRTLKLVENFNKTLFCVDIEDGSWYDH